MECEARPNMRTVVGMRNHDVAENLRFSVEPNPICEPDYMCEAIWKMRTGCRLRSHMLIENLVLFAKPLDN